MILDKGNPRYQFVEKLQPVLGEKAYYLLVSKTFSAKYPQLAEQIWAAVHDAKQTDAYQDILKKYAE